MAKYEEFDTNEEMVASPEAEGTLEVAETDNDRQTYALKDGSEGSRAAFIRELFLEDHMSRKDISDKHSFPYRVVYSATVNMTNDAEPAGRGRSAGNPMIKVVDGKLVNELEDGTFAIAETEEAVDASLVETVSRNEWVQEQVAAGISRGDIAKALDLSYGVIYNLTKEQEGTRSKHEVELEDGSVVSRAEYIRQLYADGDGMSRSDIAKELDVPYSVVWQATRVEKTNSHKYNELVDQLEAFVALTADPTHLESLIESLQDVIILDEEAAE